MDDKAIILLYQSRDENALAETAKAYGGMCTAQAMYILNSREDAEECVSDVYMRTWNAIPPAQPESLRAYLLAATRRTALNMLEKRTAQKRGNGLMTELSEELSDVLPAADDVQKQVESKMLTDAVKRFLRGLPADHRKMFMLRYFSMQNARDIARAMHKNENTVRSVLMRTRRQLKEFLEKEELL